MDQRICEIASSNRSWNKFDNDSAAGSEHSDTAVLCFAPTHKKDFVDFYYEFHDKLDEYCTGIGCYYSKAFGNPIFHSSIGVFNVDCLQSIMNMIFSSYAFGLAKINALELYTYPMQLIERYELTK